MILFPLPYYRSATVPVLAVDPLFPELPEFALDPLSAVLPDVPVSVLVSLLPDDPPVLPAEPLSPVLPAVPESVVAIHLTKSVPQFMPQLGIKAGGCYYSIEMGCVPKFLQEFMPQMPTSKSKQFIILHQT